MGFKQSRKIGEAVRETKRAIHQSLIFMMNRAWPQNTELHGELDLEELMNFLEDCIQNDRKSLRINRRVVRAYNHTYPMFDLREVDYINDTIDRELKEEEE